MLRGRRYDITVPNVHARNQDKTDGKFHDELVDINRTRGKY
jgi:hypothetical protein